jgi:TolA-binding protein
MKKQILASLILASLSTGAFALPGSAAQAPQNELKATLAADGSDRTGPNRIAEGGAERLQERMRVAEGGAERLQERMRVAEGGAERLQERMRVAEGGAERLQERLGVAEDGSERSEASRIG